MASGFTYVFTGFNNVLNSKTSSPVPQAPEVSWLEIWKSVDKTELYFTLYFQVTYIPDELQPPISSFQLPVVL